ncbi:MAG: regulatory protein RecX [Hydrocarboniphaga effusa]|nr:regulatory protein RecX [Hydrocarboniphaga effusa]
MPVRPPRQSKEPGDPKARAIKLLARREHSARELKRKLEARGIGEEQASAAVAELNREGWQSDERYAEMLVRSRISQGFGPVRIAAELKMAGVPAEQSRSALEQAGADWRALAVEVQAKHFADLPKSSAERAKQYRYLQGRGFDSSQIESALKGDVDE